MKKKKKDQGFSIQKFVRLDKDLADKLEVLAGIKKTTESQLIRDALVDYFDKFYEHDRSLTKNA